MDSDFDVKRRAILEGAAEVFVRSGFAAGTTKDIAAEVNLSQPAIYHYVGSKADLLREIVLQVDRDLMTALDSGLRSSRDPAEQLSAVIENYTDAVVRDRRSFAVFWQEQRSLEPEIRERISADHHVFVEKVGRLVARLQKRHEMPEGPSLVVARAIFSMPTWMYQWYRPTGKLTAQQVADIYKGLIGLK